MSFFVTGMKTDLFHSCGYCWVFQICWHIECSTFTASCFRIWNSSTGIPSPPLSLFVVMLPKAHLTSHSRMSGIMITMTMKKNNSVIRRSLLRFPWAARRSNQSVLKEINPEYSLERQMLKLKLQYFGHLKRRTDSVAKTLMLGKIERRRRRGRQRMRRLNGMSLQDPGVGDGQGSLACCSPWGRQESDTSEWLNKDNRF